MRALKLLVGLLSLLLLIGFVVLVAGLAGLIGTAPPGAGGPAASAVALPPGAEIVDMAATGDRLALQLRLADGSRSLYIIDPVSGGLAATIRLEDGRLEGTASE